MDFKQYREMCLEHTAKGLRASVTPDVLIIQSITTIEELDEIINRLTTRVREWYAWSNPEFCHFMRNQDKSVELIATKPKEVLLKEVGMQESVGGNLSEEDSAVISNFALHVQNIIELRDHHKTHLENILKKHCPNVHIILGTTLTARIIRHTGSLRKLAMTPAPVIQIMGAEKALFKHLSQKSRSPKYGFLFAHPLIAQVARKHHGKMARAIADKTALAAKADFFTQSPLGANLRKDLEKKVAMLVSQ
ncbi:MAG: hypothetical protein ACMXYE_00590 [Candidatus Woesearchaeota archaeon]